MSLKGLCITTVTPFDNTGNIDESSLRKLTDFYIDAGVNGMLVSGVKGEGSTLTENERSFVMNVVMEQTNGRVPVVVGCVAPDTNGAKELSEKAEQSGAKAVMVAPPNNLNNEGILFNHFEEVAKDISIPIIVLDEPPATGVKMSPSFLAKLANGIENVQYVKLTDAPTTVKITKTLDQTNKLKILGARAGVCLYEELVRGAVGNMSGFAFPEVSIKTIELFSENKLQEAKEYFYKNLPLILFEAQHGVKVRKEIFKLRGIIDTSYVRSPEVRVDQKTMKELEELIDFVGLAAKV